MKIIIIGAGLGGLSAALCFARAGHNVQLLEQRSSISPQGSGINVRPGAARILHQWGLEAELKAISDESPTVLMRELQTGDITMRNVLMHASECPDWGTMRDELIQVLYRRAVEAGAVIRFQVTVTDVTEASTHGRVKTKDGNELKADLVLAADGIRSQVRSKIIKLADVDIDPLVSDVTLYGIRLHASELAASLPSRLTDNTSINVWIGEEGFVVSRWQDALQQFGGLYAIKGATDQKGMWDDSGDIEYVRSVFANACPEMVIPLQEAQKCDRWKLAELPNLPSWMSEKGRIALLGDSAHGMHPNAAQGFSQIVESIGVLEYLIGREDHPTKSIPEILRVWEKVRKPRVERIKAYARWNTSLFTGQIKTPKHDGPTGDVKDLRNIEGDMNASFNSAKFVKWALGYDAVSEAKKYVERNKAKL